jgi:hypothetical protein
VVEVVWSRALCPVRSRLINIPTGETNFRYGDVVLHDGAPVGYRRNSAGQERPVFNVLELIESSRFSTYEASVKVGSAEELEVLERLCDEAGIRFEDWTASLRNLCRACSEGRPHEGHDLELKASNDWESSRRVGFAAEGPDALNGVVKAWTVQSGCQVSDLRCTLDAGAIC